MIVVDVGRTVKVVNVFMEVALSCFKFLGMFSKKSFYRLLCWCIFVCGGVYFFFSSSDAFFRCSNANERCPVGVP